MSAPAVCAFCGGVAEGNFSVHRDGLNVGPEVELCDACGGSEQPTLADIWARIAQPSTGRFAFKQIGAKA